MVDIVKQDAEYLLQYREGLKRTLAYIDKIKNIFPEEKQSTEVHLTTEQRDTARQVWSTYLDYHHAIGNIAQKYKDYSDIKDNDELRQLSFNVYRSAFNAQYLHAMQFIEKAEKNSQLDHVLNEASERYGFGSNIYKDFKFLYLNVITATEFAAMEAKQALLKRAILDNLMTTSKEDSSGIWEMGKGKGEWMTIKNAGTIIKKTGLEIIYPVQVSVSEWMGDTRVYRKHQSLISVRDIQEKIQPRIKPGDIIFERREWFLSNIGLPGYWPHAALYVGTEKERAAYFDDEQVKNWLQDEKGIKDGSANSYLKSLYPKAYADSLKPWHEKTPAILEAMSEGVVFTSLEYSTSADAVSVIRPNLNKIEILKALAKAFSHAGKPYDFNFDFQSDNSIVCSELVHKSYEGLLNFEVPRYMGRFVLSPNEMIRQVIESEKNEKRLADLVVFLDGNEYKKAAYEKDPAEFKESWKRPKWHIIVNRSDKGEK